ncbi:MAG: DUF1295 domain-containing protein [Muribaculaceae bacterium]|nr:DUF1295 domain-containing protein [Muribaculaceae bacterium]
MFGTDTYYTVLSIMVVLAVIVFIALGKITPGYGITYDKKWGPSINNRIGWILMEAPVFFAMLAIWLTSPRRGEPTLIVITSLFLIHYFQRSFIFPMMLKGKSRMPLVIIIAGVIFNLVNAYLIGGWLFYVADPGFYRLSWLYSPLFILGCIIFIAGMAINLNSDYIIRHLRKPGDTKHYIPHGGLFRYVTSANYLGEITEWLGYAILSWSPGAAVFVIWTFANLAPRARATHRRYLSEFGDEYARLRRRYIIPFIY